MTAAAPERLHLLAHRAVIGTRDVDDWSGTALTTALVALALARHAQAAHATALAAMSRLRRWVDAGEPRNTTDDTVALALMARAGTDLQQRDPSHVELAVRTLEAQLGRPKLQFPELHLALLAWSLDELMPDRQVAPWPLMRQRIEASPNPRGVDTALRAYTSGIAAERFDAGVFARTIMTSVGQSPGAIDGAILTWVLTAAIDKLAAHVPSTDLALNLLIERRAAIVESLASVLDDSNFREPDPDVAAAGWSAPYLTVFEAALLDGALAPRDPAVGWLTENEARVMFGEEAEGWHDRHRSTRSKSLRIVSGLVVALSAVTAALLWQTLAFALDLTGTLPLVAAGAILAAGLAAATWVLHRDPNRWPLIGRARVFATTFALLLAVLTVNLALPEPFVSDVGGLIGSTLLSLVAALVTPAGGHPENR